MATRKSATRTRSQSNKTKESDAFIEAAGRGDLKSVISGIQAGIDVDALSSGFLFHKETALTKAVSGRHFEVVNVLLEARADPNKPDSHHVRPIHLVRDVAILQLLLKAGADIDDAGLFRFCRGAAIMESLIQAGARLDGVDVLGRTMLMNCCFQDPYTMDERRRLVKTLVHAGLSVNARDSDGKSVLHYAARTSDPDFLKLLIEMGANFDVRDNHGAGVWDDLRGGNDWKTKQYQGIKTRAIELGLYDPRVDELVLSVSRGKLSTVKTLIAKGVDLNARGDLVSPTNPEYMLTGIPSLDAAAMFDHLRIVKWLVEAGANPNVLTDRPGLPLRSVLEATVSDGRPKAVQLLLGAGASVKGVDLFNVFIHRRGHWTSRHNECIRLLIDAGIDLNAVQVFDEDEGETTLLDAAKRTRNKSLMKMLVQVSTRGI